MPAVEPLPSMTFACVNVKLFMMTTGSKLNLKITNIPFRVDALHNNRSFDHTIGGRQVLLVFFAVVQQEIGKYFAQQWLIGVTVYLWVQILKSFGRLILLKPVSRKKKQFAIGENVNGSAIVIYLFQVQFGREKGDVVAPQIVTFESLQF